MKIHATSMFALCLAATAACAQAPAAPQLKLMREVAVAPDLLSVAAVPGTARAYAGGTDGKIHLFDFDEAKPRPVSWEAHVSYVSGLALAGKHLVSAGSDHQLVWWDVETRKKVRTLDAHGKKWIRGLALSPDGKILASVGDDMAARLWDAGSGKPVRELAGHEKLTPFGLRSKLYCCRFSPDGKFLAAGDQAGHVIIWDVESGKQAGKIHAPLFYTADTNGHTYGGVRCVAFSPDGKLLALSGNKAGDTSTITGSQGLVQLYDWKAGKQTHDFRLKVNAFIESVCFDPKGSWLFAAAGAGEGNKVLVLDLEKKEVAREFLSKTQVFGMTTLDAGSGSLIAVGRKKAQHWQMPK